MINVGLIGVGKMGSIHLEKLLFLKGYFNLIGLYDEDINKSQTIGKKNRVLVFSSLESLLEKIDITVIATTSLNHFDIINKCIDYHVGIFVEKPMVTNIQHAKRLIYRSSEIYFFYVGYVERYNPVFLFFKEIIKNEKIKFVSFVRKTNVIKSKDTDVILDIMIHDLDLAMDLLNEDYSIVSVINHRKSSDSIDEIETIFETKTGTVLEIFSSRISDIVERRIVAITPNHYYEVDLIEKKIFIRDQSDIKKVLSSKKYGQDAVENELINMAKCFRNEKRTKSDLYSSYRLHLIIDQMYSVIKKGLPHSEEMLC